MDRGVKEEGGHTKSKMLHNANSQYHVLVTRLIRFDSTWCLDVYFHSQFCLPIAIKEVDKFLLSPCNSHTADPTQ